MIKEINKEKTVVIVIDVQNDYVHEDGIMSKFWGTKNLQEKNTRYE